MASSSKSGSKSGSKSMESRTGRNKQRYNSKGERLVAGVVPLSEDKAWVMLIQSDRRKAWVLPKGGWETDEDCMEAAEREAWEEAGISITIDYDLGEIVESRPPKSGSSSKSSSKKRETALYHFFEATVTHEATDWPEKAKRQRKWMSFVDAWEELKDRPELQEALDRSTIKR